MGNLRLEDRSRRRLPGVGQEPTSDTLVLVGQAVKGIAHSQLECPRFLDTAALVIELRKHVCDAEDSSAVPV